MSQSLRQIVTSFRGGILGKSASDGMCYAVCAPLQGYLSLLGYETELIKGLFHRSSFESIHMEHYWLQLPDNRIIDPTADQFKKPDNSPMPKVYIGKLPAWYKLAK